MKGFVYSKVVGSIVGYDFVSVTIKNVILQHQGIILLLSTKRKKVSLRNYVNPRDMAA